MNKFSLGGGVAIAVAAFALTATVAFACPAGLFVGGAPQPVKSTPPAAACPPQPCGSCGCNSLSNAAFVQFDQNQLVQGLVPQHLDPVGEQTAWGEMKVSVGSDVEAKTTFDMRNFASANTAPAPAAGPVMLGTQMSQNQTGQFGASATTANANLFPSIWTAKTQGIGSQSAFSSGTDIVHDLAASSWQHSRVGESVSSLDFGLRTKKEAENHVVTDTQNFNSGTQAQGWAVTPFPKSHTFDFLLGNNVGRLIQEINLKNLLLFG